ncbi:MAG: beta-eliminating lyase-related protein, partial [Pseudomonadota bacterium]
QPAAVSITQATEAGTLYTVEEVRALAAVAKAAVLPVHMDGTRFANALAATGATPAEMSWKAGVDILCLGFTKNGALAAEAIIVFDPAKDWELQLRRKRGGHLFSKMRFVTAQVEAMMAGDLWLRLAAHANDMATRLAKELRDIDGIDLLHPVDANLMFARVPDEKIEAARAEGAMFYDMPDAPGSAPDGKRMIRLVCSFQTRPEDVDALLTAFTL